jgi:hypothetical protein
MGAIRQRRLVKKFRNDPKKLDESASIEHQVREPFYYHERQDEERIVGLA